MPRFGLSKVHTRPVAVSEVPRVTHEPLVFRYCRTRLEPDRLIRHCRYFEPDGSV